MKPPNEPTAPVTVTASRGTFVENTHAVTIVIAAPDGEILAAWGDPSTPMVLRSTAKPFQALPLFSTDAMKRFNISGRELALACASHDGTEAHLQLVSAWLTRIGLTHDALDCGPHAPGHGPSAHALIRAGSVPTALHNNCSGKHTGMLASCLAAGWPRKDYLSQTHPLQEAIHATLERLTGATVRQGGVDGCSAPTFSMPVAGLAKLYAYLAAPACAPEQDREGLSAAFDAMSQFPELVAGPTTIDTRLMQFFPKLVCKRGAAGGYGMAARESKLGDVGVAIWVHDGSSEARAAAVIGVLEFLELTPWAGFSEYKTSLLQRTNCVGAVVGALDGPMD